MEIDFQKIYDLIEPTFPNGWRKVFLYCAFWGSSCETKYFISTESGEIIDCLQLPEFDAVFEAICAINQLLFDSRNDNSMWSVVTIVIDDTGAFNSYFDYSNALKEQKDYFDIWKMKYIYGDSING